MKKSVLMLAFATVLGVSAATAQADPPPAKAQHQEKKGTPEQQAARQAAHMQKELGLSDDQKTKIEAFALTRIKANEPLKEKARATQNADERKTIGKEMKTNMDTFDTSVNGVLTADQQTKWKQMKEERRKEHGGRHDKSGKAVDTPPAPED